MHLTAEEIAKLLANRLQPADQRRIVRHLLAGCGLCSRKLVAGAPGLLLEKAAEDRRRKKALPSSPRERALSAALEQEARGRTDERKRTRILELLRVSPGGYDGLTLRQMQGLHGPPLVEALVQRSFELRFRDLSSMRWLAFNAVQASESLSPERYAPSSIFGTQARAWGGLAHSYSLNDEYAEAEIALEQARTLLRRGSGDPRLLAHLSWIEAGLRTSQRRLSEASELLGKVHRLYLRLGEKHLAGRALISQAIGIHYGGRSRRAIPLLRTALSLVDAEREPQTLWAGRQSLINALLGAGEYRKASEMLLRSGLRQAFAQDALSLLKLRWTEGKLLARIGSSARAERALLAVHAGFLDLAQKCNAAFCGLDLLPVLLSQGKHQEVRRVARATFETLTDLGFRQEADQSRRYLQ